MTDRGMLAIEDGAPGRDRPFPHAARRLAMRALRSGTVDRWLEQWRRWQQGFGRRLHPELHPRRWSNDQLRVFAPHLRGDIVNVSGWQDGDKEGARYQSYFPECRSYTITNYPAGARSLEDGAAGAISLDLARPLPEALEQAFDVVLCHTVLEHVFDFRLAMTTLAQMSRDVVILVVPFIQDEHQEPGSYADFWRFAPASLLHLVESVGLRVLYLSSNDNVWWPTYLFAFACRNPERWTALVPPAPARTRPIGGQLFNPRLDRP